jgi:putative copper resistance protein D
MPGVGRRWSIVVRGLAGLALASAPAGVMPTAALAHGGVVPPEPTAASVLLDWSFDPHIQLAVLGAAALYLIAVRRVDRDHPANRVPRRRPLYFLAGLLAIEVALQSGIERYDTTLFSVHMVQHMLLTLVAAPLLVLGAPITLLLRVASPSTRRRWILPFLHSRVVRVISHPLVTWGAFTAVMWLTHVTPMFDAALESEPLHQLEHALYLGTALLFWWPVIGADPSPWRMHHPGRLGYLFLQMPQSTFLAVLIYSATTALYPHYATTGRTWGPTVVEDQQAAGALMWVWGDLTFLIALLLVLAVWWRAEEAKVARQERRIDAERAAIQEREVRLAEIQSGDGR